MSSPDAAPRTPGTPRVVVVAGSGRSGTSTIAGVLKQLGLHVPQPEVPGNRTNPRGFFEPQWVVELQTRLLRRAGAMLTDARPHAFERTASVGREDDVRAEVGAWLGAEVQGHGDVVVKDPRSSWFLPMWRQASADAGAEVLFLTMLRHPAEVVGSKDAYYKSRSAGESVRHAQTTRVAGWLNVALMTEATTRDARRTFVLYDELVEDWRTALGRALGDLDLAVTHPVTDEAAAAIDEFVDPGLRRIRTTWDDLDCPAWVRDAAEETWTLLSTLAASGGSDAAAEARLDELRAAYEEAYLDAEALAQSSAEAAARRAVAKARRDQKKEQQAARQARRAGQPGQPGQPGPTAKAGLLGRVAARVRSTGR